MGRFPTMEGEGEVNKIVVGLALATMRAVRNAVLKHHLRVDERALATRVPRERRHAGP
jgi:hypothetical protein